VAQDAKPQKSGGLAALLKTLARGVGAALRWALDAALPPRCLLCRKQMMEGGALCPSCWGKVRFISAPFCAVCGAPFGIPVEEGTLCPACLEKPPLYHAARSAFLYDEESRGLVLAFKSGDRLDAAPGLAEMMARAGADLKDRVDLLVPVPLHPLRLWTRRYNQAAVLAFALGRLWGKKVAVEALVRVRATPSQGHLSGAARHKNMEGALVVPEQAKKSIQGKRVLVIDDVMTSGATAEVAAKALLESGASEVFILTLARALKDGFY